MKSPWNKGHMHSALKNRVEEVESDWLSDSPGILLDERHSSAFN